MNAGSSAVVASAVWSMSPSHWREKKTARGDSTGRGAIWLSERLRAQMPPTAFRGPGRVAIVGHRAEEGARHTDRVLVTARLVKTARLTIVVLASEALAFYSRRPPKGIAIHEASSCYASNTHSHRGSGCAATQGRAPWR